MPWPLPWPFDRTYMQLALVAGLAVGLAAPLVGGFLVQRGVSLLGDGIGHSAVAGVGAGLLLEWSPVWSALAVAVAAAVLIEALRARGRVSGDLALAIVFYGGIAAGVVLASRATAAASLDRYLFGSILTVDAADAYGVLALGALVVTTIAITGRALLAVVLDEDSAKVAGLPVRGLNTLIAVLTAVTIVAAMRVVGVLLVAALMVLPIATSRLWARTFRGTLLGGSGVGTLSVVVGLAAARAFALAPGGTIVLTTVAIFAVVSAAPLVPRSLRRA